MRVLSVVSPFWPQHNDWHVLVIMAGVMSAKIWGPKYECRFNENIEFDLLDLGVAN